MSILQEYIDNNSKSEKLLKEYFVVVPWVAKMIAAAKTAAVAWYVGDVLLTAAEPALTAAADHAGYATKWWRDYLYKHNYPPPQGEFKQEVYRLNKTMANPYKTNFNPFKERTDDEESIIAMEDHPYIYWDRGSDKWKIWELGKQFFLEQKKALEELDSDQSEKHNLLMNRLNKAFEFGKVSFIDKFGKEEGTKAYNQIFQKYPYIRHDEELGFYSITRFPWRWNKKPISQNAYAYDLLVGYGFQSLDDNLYKPKFGKNKKYDVFYEPDAELPASASDTKKQHYFIYKHSLYTGKIKESSIPEEFNTAQIKEFTYQEASVYSSAAFKKYQNYLAKQEQEKTNARVGSYATIDMASFDKAMEDDEDARLQAQVDKAAKKDPKAKEKASDLMSNKEYQSAMNYLDELEKTGNENSKKVVKQIKTLKKQELKNIDVLDALNKGVEIQKDIPSIIDSLERIENGEPIEKRYCSDGVCGKIPELGDKPLPGQSVPTIDEQTTFPKPNDTVKIVPSRGKQTPKTEPVKSKSNNAVASNHKKAGMAVSSDKAGRDPGLYYSVVWSDGKTNIAIPTAKARSPVDNNYYDIAYKLDGTPVGFLKDDTVMIDNGALAKQKRFEKVTPPFDNEFFDLTVSPPADRRLAKKDSKSKDSPEQSDKAEEESANLLKQAEAGRALPFDKNNKTMGRIQNSLLKKPTLKKAKLTLAKIQGNLINYFEDPQTSSTFEDSLSAQKYFKQIENQEAVKEQRIPNFQVLGDGNYGDETKEAIKNFQKDMIKKGKLKPLKDSPGRKGFSNIDGLYGPNTHKDQFLPAQKAGLLRTKPIQKAVAKEKETGNSEVVTKDSDTGKKLVKKAAILQKTKRTRVNLGKDCGKIPFAKWMRMMIAKGCIHLDTKKGKKFIPPEKKKECQLCTRNLKKKVKEKPETFKPFKVAGYTATSNKISYEIQYASTQGKRKLAGTKVLSYRVAEYKKSNSEIKGPDVIYVPTTLIGTESQRELESTRGLTKPVLRSGRILPLYSDNGDGMGWLFNSKAYFKPGLRLVSNDPKEEEKVLPEKIIILKDGVKVSEVFDNYYSQNTLLANKADLILERIEIDNYIQTCCLLFDIEY